MTSTCWGLGPRTVWAYATIAPTTSAIARFGGVVGDPAPRAVGEDAAAEGRADRAAPETTGLGTERADAMPGAEDFAFLGLVRTVPTTPASATSASTESASVMAFVELFRSVVSAFELRGERAAPLVLEAVPSCVDDVEPELDGSACATPVKPPSGAQTVAARAPVPSHTATLTPGCCARWRLLVRGALLVTIFQSPTSLIRGYILAYSQRFAGRQNGAVSSSARSDLAGAQRAWSHVRHSR